MRKGVKRNRGTIFENLQRTLAEPREEGTNNVLKRITTSE